MARRIAREITLSIAAGGKDTNTPPTWGTAQNIHGKAREISIRYNGRTIDLAGLADEYSRIRFAGPAKYTIRIGAFIPTQGFDFYISDTPPIGYRIRVSVKPISTLQNPYVFDGIIMDWQWSAQASEAQVEEIEIEGPLDDY